MSFLHTRGKISGKYNEVAFVYTKRSVANLSDN